MYFVNLNEIVSKVRRNNLKLKVMMRRKGKGRGGGVHDVETSTLHSTLK